MKKHGIESNIHEALNQPKYAKEKPYILSNITKRGDNLNKGSYRKPTRETPSFLKKTRVS